VGTDKSNDFDHFSLRWAAVSATARLVMMYMTINDWGAADERLHAFFRLVKRLEELEPTQAQRDKWGLDSYVTTMTKNHCVVEEILLEAEISQLANASCNWNMERTSPRKLMSSYKA